MSFEPATTLRGIFDETSAAHQRFAGRSLTPLAAAAAAVSGAVTNGRKVLAFGNGGSATDAQHFVAELVGRFEGERRALAGIALTCDSAIMTAISNDYGYDHVFARQIEALGCGGDIAIGISTSGQSKNVESALCAAKSRGMLTIALTGHDGGRMGAAADIHLNVAESATPRVQEVHRTILHAMCTLIDIHVRSASAEPAPR